MRKIKYLTVLLLGIILFFQFLYSEKRATPLSMKDLTDPSSPSYVPIPFPKTDEDIIFDMKYAIKKLFVKNSNTHETLIGPLPKFRQILPELLKEKTSYKIGQIIKVKNFLSRCPYGYYLLVPVLNKDNSKAACVIIDATGLYGGVSSGFARDSYAFTKSEEDIISELGEILNQKISPKEIQYFQAVELPPHMGRFFLPAFEIKLKQGDVYYYSTEKKEFFSIKKEIPWQRNNNGIRPNMHDLVNHSERFAYDEINDKLIVFEKLRE